MLLYISVPQVRKVSPRMVIEKELIKANRSSIATGTVHVHLIMAVDSITYSFGPSIQSPRPSSVRSDCLLPPPLQSSVCSTGAHHS